MLIDPFTVVAQIVNFAILAIALKYVLYDRVVAAMDERQASIASRLNEAEQREAEARSEAESFAQSRRQLDHDRHELMQQARADANRHRQDLLDQARVDVEEERRRWHRALRAEQGEFHLDLQRRTAEETVELSRRALDELASAELEATVVQLGLDHLAADHEARSELLGGDDSAAPLTVRTAFALSPDHRRQLAEGLRAAGLGPDRQVRFERDPSLILGVQFLGDGTVVSWHVDDYLRRLGQSFDEYLDSNEPESAGPEADDH